MPKITLTRARIAEFRCPIDRKQAFLWDASQPGLGVRITPTGKPAFVFQAPYRGRDVRITIGSPDSWDITDAQIYARRLMREIDQGRDPRKLKADEIASAKADRVRMAAEATTVSEAWGAYLNSRKPYWRDRTLADHVNMAVVAGTAHSREKNRSRKAAPIAALLPLRLVQITPDLMLSWVEREAKDRPARARLALRMFSAFLRWAAAEPRYKALVDPSAVSSRRLREAAGRPTAKRDVLQREQLPAWFASVRAIPNQTVSAYLQCLLLTGARREELISLRWEDVNFKWSSMHISDKTDDAGREVPLTSYVAELLKRLPKRNEWVFASVRRVDPSEQNVQRRAQYHVARGQVPPVGELVVVGARGHIAAPSKLHRRACLAAGIEGLTLHGLRRSFATLCEWLETPVGIWKQIQGHSPEGVRERHYIRRSVDLLRVHHQKFESWVLAEANVEAATSTGASARPLALVESSRRAKE